MARRRHNPPELSEHELGLMKRVRRDYDYNAFSMWFFELPYSGTIYTPEDRVDQYNVLHEAWRVSGKPDEVFDAQIDGLPVTFKLMWGGYGSEPAILYPHGYIFLPWGLKMLQTRKLVCIAEGGTGSAKTSTIGIAGMIKCAVFPGFDFLNVAPSSTQAQDMMDEVAKWVTNSRFSPYVKRNQNGELWSYKPYPFMTIDFGLGVYSTFGCMTLGIHGGVKVLGKGKDWISVDEASLVPDIGVTIPHLITRYRGSRRDGKPRYSIPAFSLITNPHDNNASFDLLKAKAIRETDDLESVYYFIRPSTLDNVYITAQQIKLQRAILDTAQQRRWIDGSDFDFKTRGDIPSVLIESCTDAELTTQLETMIELEDDRVVAHDEMGVIDYRLPPVEGRSYIVWGDPGSANMTSLSENNVGTCGALDVTDFPDHPARLVAVRFVSGGGKYIPWIDALIELMLDYRPLVAAYDATGMGKVFSEWPDLAKYPLYPVVLGGMNKAESKGLFLLFTSAGLFAWPFLKALVHQANAYRETGSGRERLPDDLISGLFVASFYMRYHFYDALARIFNWDEEGVGVTEIEDSTVRTIAGRYAARLGTRYGRSQPRRVRSEEVLD